MVSEHAGLAAARQPVRGDRPSGGFTFAWEHHRLDLTVEARMPGEEFAGLFTDEDRQKGVRPHDPVRMDRIPP